MALFGQFVERHRNNRKDHNLSLIHIWNLHSQRYLLPLLPVVKPNVDELEMLFETKIKSTKEIVEYAHEIRNLSTPAAFAIFTASIVALSAGSSVSDNDPK